MEMIRTKFVPPLKPSGIIGRPRLRDITPLQRQKATLVRAPAGFGKTTLLAQWFDDLKLRGAIVGWVTLDERERSGGRLVGCIAAMMGRDPRTGIDLDGFLREQSKIDIDAQIAALATRLETAAQPVYLFFDDIHLAGREAAAALQQFIRALPDNARVVLASRGIGHLPVAAMRAYGELDEVTASDLAFTVAEATALLGGTGRHRPDAGDVEALVSQTEGWATGLSLAAADSQRDPDRRLVLPGFSGRRRVIADFFEETVWSIISDELRGFLQQTAILDRLDPEMCDALTGRTDSAALLRRIDEMDLFIVRQDDEGAGRRFARYFAAYLRRRFAEADPAGFKACHARAARMLLERKLRAEALAHARAADDEALLCAVLEEVSESLTFAGKVKLVADYAADLSEGALSRCPRTALSVAWLHIRGLRFLAARRLIDMAAAETARLRETGAGPETIAGLARTVRHREMLLAAARDDIPAAEDICSELMRNTSGDHPYIVSTVYGHMAAARREQFRFDDTERLHAQGRATAEQAGFRFALVSLQAAAGASLFASGRTEAATTALRTGLDEGIRWAGEGSGLAAIAALPLAEVAYEQNDLDTALSLAEAYLPVARDLCIVDQLVSGHLVSARLHAARADQPRAERALDGALDLAMECGLDRLRLAVLGDQVRMLLHNGEPEVAARQASKAGGQDAASLAPNARTTTSDELRALIFVRIAASQNRTSEALALARHWRSFCQQRGAVRSLVRWNLLIAQVMMISGDSCAAQRTMRDAIAAAGPAGLVRPFLDEGAAVLSILADAYEDAPPSPHPSDIFAARVLDAFNWKRPAEILETSDDGLYGRLTAKELEILRLVGCGMRNREIGSRVGLTEGSVKWYMQQVYDKVGVRRRSQAVERARQFGLIPDGRAAVPIWR
ncbi:MAG: AAA family ATPase [Rhizobiaceae bacterium]|nr:AAA family ATPase [Rhizobiaceae bacterium]